MYSKAFSSTYLTSLTASFNGIIQTVLEISGRWREYLARDTSNTKVSLSFSIFYFLKFTKLDGIEHRLQSRNVNYSSAER